MSKSGPPPGHTVKPNRQCKECGTYYRDPGGKVGDPKRYCPTCGSWAWYWVNDQEAEK